MVAVPVRLPAMLGRRQAHRPPEIKVFARYSGVTGLPRHPPPGVANTWRGRARRSGRVAHRRAGGMAVPGSSLVFGGFVGAAQAVAAELDGGDALCEVELECVE